MRRHSYIYTVCLSLPGKSRILNAGLFNITFKKEHSSLRSILCQVLFMPKLRSQNIKSVCHFLSWKLPVFFLFLKNIHAFYDVNSKTTFDYRKLTFIFHVHKTESFSYFIFAGNLQGSFLNFKKKEKKKFQ